MLSEISIKGFIFLAILTHFFPLLAFNLAHFSKKKKLAPKRFSGATLALK